MNPDPVTPSPEDGQHRRPSRDGRPVRFVLLFLLWIGLFSLAFRIPWVDSLLIVPMTKGLAAASGLLLELIGFGNEVAGTVITGEDGFSVNILKGCNGAYVMAIFMSAVLAFPATWRERGLGILLGLPAVQAINVARILSLYWIGARHPALFERFHYHVWQTLVILLSMALWLLWAEFLVGKPRR